MSMTLVIEAARAPGSAEAVRATLDWARAQRARLLADILVVVRGSDLGVASVVEAARAECTGLPLGVMKLAASGDHAPVDPAGCITGALRGDHLLWLEAGVVPESTDAVVAAVVAMSRSTGGEAGARARRIGAIGGVVRGAGRVEAPPMPGCWARGGVLVSRDAVRAAGGLSRLLGPGDAAWADLAWRMRRGHSRVLRDDALRFHRVAGRAADLGGSGAAAFRDALIVVERYLPRGVRAAYRHELFAAARRGLGGRQPERRESPSHLTLAQAAAEARRWASWERTRGRRPLGGGSLEKLLNWSQMKLGVSEWAAPLGGKRVALVGLGWPTYAVRRAARAAGLEVVAVLDDAAAGGRYRGVPIRPLVDTRGLKLDGVLAVGRLREAAEEMRRSVRAAGYRGPIFSAAAGRLSRLHHGAATPAATSPAVRVVEGVRVPRRRGAARAA